MKIDKNIPVPLLNHKYPFGEMSVGDSFVVSKDISGKARRASWHYGRRHGMKFTSRKISDSEYRCWRIE